MLCKIGDIEVWRILESNDPFKTPEELYPTAGPDVQRLFEEQVPGGCCETSGRIILPVQGFLLKSGPHVVLVDACVGNDKTVPSTPDWHQRKSPRFMMALAAAGVTPDDVTHVMCTHLHTDHVGWNTQLVDGRWVPTFANAKYLLPEADRAFYDRPENPIYQESVSPVVAAGLAEFVTAGYVIGELISLLPTPGHTPGHVSVRLTSQGQEAIITGDAIHTTAQMAYPNWHFKYDTDAEQAVTSRRFLLETASSSAARILGTHFALPSLGRVKAKGDIFEWTPD